MNQEDDFLSMLSQLDAEAEAKKKEIITVETPVFDPVQHIASVLEKRTKQDAAGRDNNYLEGLKQNYLAEQPETDFLVQLLSKETEKVNLKLDTKNTDFKSLAFGASKRLNQEITRIPEGIKVPEETVKQEPKEMAVKETPFNYLTLTGQFLPISPEALLAANQIYESLKEFQEKIPDIRSVEELSKLLIVKSLSDLITDAAAKKNLLAQLKGKETKEESVLYSLFSITNPDTKFFEKVKNYGKVVKLRKQVAKEITENLKKLLPTETTYAALADKINLRIITELERVIQDFQKPTDERSFKNFTNTLVDQVLNPKYIVNREDKEFKKGYAVIAKEVRNYTTGTIVQVQGNCDGHKGNIKFTNPRGEEDCLPKDNLLKLEDLVGEVIPVEGKPKIGDLVVITRGGGYGVTKDGSWGYVRGGNDAYRTDIEFHHVTGDKHALPVHFPIDRDNFQKAEFKKKKKIVEEKKYFRLGDIVKLRKESEFTVQNKTEGKIIDLDPFNEELPYVIEFKDGYKNSYGEKDLEIADKKSARAKEIKNQKENDEKDKTITLEEKIKITETVKKIIDEETEKDKEATEKNNQSVKESLDKLLNLGISKEIAHSYVKSQLRNKTQFITAGILMSDEEEQKAFNNLKDLTLRVKKNGTIYEATAQKICEEIEKKYNLFLDREKIKDEKDFITFKENIGEIFYDKTYTKNPAGKVTGPGLVVLIKKEWELEKGTVGKIEDEQVCATCGLYHKFCTFDGAYWKVTPANIRKAEKAFPEVGGVELNKGARVRIRKNSPFVRQADCPGVVMDEFGAENLYGDPAAHVTFDNGFTGAYYRKIDLELANPVVDPVLNAKKQEIINKELPVLKEIIAKCTVKGEDDKQKLSDMVFSIKSELETLGYGLQSVKEFFHAKIGDTPYRILADDLGWMN